MEFTQEIEIFINDYVKDLNNGTAALFAGAGMSIPAGFVNWSDLLAEIAQDLGLDITAESDLVSLAQFHVNENRNRNKINRKILEEFTEDAEETENHRIMARLPIDSVWTTNYDQLIEHAYIKENKVVDVKFTINQLLTTKPKRDVVIYKMHGDVDHPTEAILTKEQYENYHQTHEPFINALTGELTTKTFLFLGFSFSDPNLDYVLSRLNFKYSLNKRQHYSFVKNPQLGDTSSPDQATLDYNVKKQKLIINDLKRYGIKSLVIDEYSEITDILNEIDFRYRRKTIFISGSAEVYDPIEKKAALSFIHIVSKKLVQKGYRVVNGFGWGIGSSVINGALDAVYRNPNKYSENQLILKPFPQFQTGGKSLKNLWEEYRQKMIAQSGISIYLHGNKLVDGEIVEANGVIREFEITRENGNISIPLPHTGYAAKSIFDTISADPKQYYSDADSVMQKIAEISEDGLSNEVRSNKLIELIIQLSR